jgi:hypothetical protein
MVSSGGSSLRASFIFDALHEALDLGGTRRIPENLSSLLVE